MALFPREDIPTIEKTPQWCKLHLDWGVRLLYSPNVDNLNATRLYRSYNGVKDPRNVKWLQETYGPSYRAKFIPYRVGRTKQYLLEGEWLKRPLTATVETINIAAKNDKMAQVDFMVGAMTARKELLELKDKAGVDVMEGAPIPENEEDPLWEKMSPKDREEDIMQIIIDEQVKYLKLVKKFSDLFRDGRITGRCFAKIEINEKGELDFRRIDPRDAIYEEIEGDDFIEKSPIKGCRIRMPIHEVLLRYELTQHQRDILYNIQSNPAPYLRNNTMIRQTSAGIMADVLHIEWKSVKPSYYKIMKKTPNQLAFDNTTDTITKEIPWEVYESKKEMYDKGVAKGEFEIVTKWEEDLWEATRIGGIPELDVNMRRKPFQMRRHDSPAYILDSSYVGCLFGTVDGLRISLQQLIENFDEAFDICMFQILKELNKIKGKILGYDLAGLPIDTTVKKIMYDAGNDGFVTYNSMADGNMAKRNLDLKGMLQTVDLGFSESFGELLALKEDLLRTLDKITGINESREGSSPASTTATNAQQSLANSRTITEPLFYQMQLFVEHCMMRIAESTKISWGIYKTEKGEQILGSEKFKYMQVTRELAMRDYGVHIEDGGRYLNIKQKMQSYIEFALNTKEISISDALRFEIAQTTVEAKQVFSDAMERVKENAMQSQQQQAEAQAQQQQMALQHEQQMIQQDVQNKAGLESQKIAEKTQSQMAIDDNKAKNKVIENHHKSSNDTLLSEGT